MPKSVAIPVYLAGDREAVNKRLQDLNRESPFEKALSFSGYVNMLIKMDIENKIIKR